MEYGIKCNNEIIAVFRYKRDREAFLEYLRETWDSKKCSFKRVFYRGVK